MFETSETPWTFETTDLICLFFLFSHFFRRFGRRAIMGRVQYKYTQKVYILKVLAFS